MKLNNEPTLHEPATRALHRVYPELASQGPIQRAVARHGWCLIKSANGDEVAIPLSEVDRNPPKPKHPSVGSLLQHFRYGHLPEDLQKVSRPLCMLAERLADTLEGPELTVGLRKLLEAKDCFVRAALEKRPPG